jgi:hypothetical protein
MALEGQEEPFSARRLSDREGWKAVTRFLCERVTVPPAPTAVERIQAGGSPNQKCLPHNTASTTTKVDSTMPIIDAYKSAGQ